MTEPATDRTSHAERSIRWRTAQWTATRACDSGRHIRGDRTFRRRRDRRRFSRDGDDAPDRLLSDQPAAGERAGVPRLQANATALSRDLRRISLCALAPRHGLDM